MLTRVAASIALMYAILIGVNLPAPLLGLEFGGGGPRPRFWYEAPGYVIPIAWFVLFALLGIARYQLKQAQPAARNTWLIIALAILCATYAYYTLGLGKLTGISPLWFGLIGNLLVIVFALFVTLKLAPASRPAAKLVFPVALWTAYATTIVLGEMKFQKLL